MKVTFDTSLRNIYLDGSNAGSLADVKANYKKDWPTIVAAITSKVTDSKESDCLAAKALIDKVEATGEKVDVALKAEVEAKVTALPKPDPIEPPKLLVRDPDIPSPEIELLP